MTRAIVPAGKAILFESGEYSDFGHCGAVVTLKACNLYELADQYRDDFEPDHDWETPGPEGFVAWLVANGHVFPAEIEEIHIGSYGELNIE